MRRCNQSYYLGLLQEYFHIDAIEECITPEMNKELLKEFKPEEVRRELNQMHLTKAPDPDGMPPLFF